MQEWDWIPRRFDPARALATPRSVLALIRPDPRVIGDDVWAKLLWAGLNLGLDDLPDNPGGRWYPLELVRAVTLTWLFGGLRSDEIARLRVGCVRWQRDGHLILHDLAVPRSRANIDPDPGRDGVARPPPAGANAGHGLVGGWPGRRGLQTGPQVPVTPVVVVHHARVAWGGLLRASVAVIPPNALRRMLTADTVLPAELVGWLADHAAARLRPVA